MIDTEVDGLVAQELAPDSNERVTTNTRPIGTDGGY